MPDPTGGREAEVEAAISCIEWYVQCLRDAWLLRRVVGMDEARAGYIAALDALRSSGSATRNRNQGELDPPLTDGERRAVESMRAAKVRRLRAELDAARSPQSEEHEA